MLKNGPSSKWNIRLVLSRVWLFVTPWTVACQAPLPWSSTGKNTGGSPQPRELIPSLLKDVHYILSNEKYKLQTSIYIVNQLLF